MKLFKLLVVLSIPLLIISCQEQAKDWIVKVNDSIITKQDMEVGFINLSSDLQQQIPENEQAQFILNQLVQAEILYQEALKKNLESNDDYKNFINRLTQQYEYQKKEALVNLFVRENIESNISVTDEEVQQVYESNKDSFFSQYEQRSISQIVLKTKEEADSVYKALKKGENFYSLAKTKSIDVKTAQNGGKIAGYFRKESLPEYISPTIFGLKSSGQFSKPVQSPAGYLLIRLDDIKVMPSQSFDEVKDFLKNQLFISKRNQQITTLLNTVKDDYEISQNEESIGSNSEQQPDQANTPPQG